MTGAAPAAVVLAEPKGDEVFALLMVMPPATRVVEGDRLPREIVFVLDRSGSMGGASIEQVQAALMLALARLRPADHFNIIRFNHTTDRLFEGAQPADSRNLATARRYVDAIRADGGTEMLPALELALDEGERSDRLRQVIFLTDGAVGHEARLFGAIRARLGDSRLFTIGIGSAPNSHFMREAARLGRGTFTRHRRAMRALPQDGSGRGGVATWALTRSASWRWRSSRWGSCSSVRAAGSTPGPSWRSTCFSGPGRGRLPASGKSAPGRGPTRGPSPGCACRCTASTSSCSRG